MRGLILDDVACRLGIRVYCNACKTWYDPRKEHLADRKKKCSHPVGKQKYKSTICLPTFGGKRKRRSTVYDTRILDEAIYMGLEFKKNLQVEAQEKAKIQKEEKPILLVDCLAMFLDHKNGVGVRKHLQKNLSTGSLAAFKRQIIYWKDATDLIGEKFSKLFVDKISDDNIDSLIEFMKKYSPSVQRKTYGFFNEFYKYLNSNGYNVKSPFEGITVSNSKKEDARAVIVSEYTKIVDSMVSGSTDDKLRGRTIYFEWFQEAMDFAALTGRRREEFMLARFSDIHLVNGELLGGFIKMIDSKYSKQHKHEIGFEPRYTKAPIYPELKEFLLEMGYEEHKDSDRYIIAGDDQKQRNTLANNLTNGFGYYRDKLGMDKKIQLKGLRKTYVTRMRNEFGDNANFFTGHADERIDKKHYYDDAELFGKVVKFVLWKKK